MFSELYSFPESFQGTHIHVSQRQFSTCFKYVHFPRVGPHSSPNRNLCPPPATTYLRSTSWICVTVLQSSVIYFYCLFLRNGALNILSSSVLCSLKGITFIHLLGVGLYIHAIEQVWIQSPNCRGQVSAFTVWVTGIKLGSSDSAVCTFTYWAISLPSPPFHGLSTHGLYVLMVPMHLQTPS